MLEPCTVVVASRDRPEKLRQCLRFLLAMDHPDFRIVVVDDGSRTPLFPIAAPFGDLVRVIRQEAAGPAAARNLGVDAAETDFVAFTDDDCRPATDWLTQLQKAHRSDPDALVGGRTVNDLTENACAAASQAIIDFLYQWHADIDDRLRFFTTNNVGFSRRTFRKVGGLDPRFAFASEDRDLGLRWRASGRRLIHARDAVVGHRHDLTLASFWRQHSSYGRGARILRRKLGPEDRRLRLEPWAFYAGLLAFPVMRADRGGLRPALTQTSLMLLSQVAMTEGYLRQAFRGRTGRRRNEVPLISARPLSRDGATWPPQVEDRGE